MTTNGSVELLVLRLAVTNSVVDPWIYILLRKETVLGLLRIKMAVCDQCASMESPSRQESAGKVQPPSKYTEETQKIANAGPPFTQIHCKGIMTFNIFSKIAMNRWTNIG